jgi:hypothetical protein
MEKYNRSLSLFHLERRERKEKKVYEMLGGRRVARNAVASAI